MKRAPSRLSPRRGKRLRTDLRTPPGTSSSRGSSRPRPPTCRSRPPNRCGSTIWTLFRVARGNFPAPARRCGTAAGRLARVGGGVRGGRLAKVDARRRGGPAKADARRRGRLGCGATVGAAARGFRPDRDPRGPGADAASACGFPEQLAPRRSVLAAGVAALVAVTGVSVALPRQRWRPGAADHPRPARDREQPHRRFRGRGPSGGDDPGPGRGPASRISVDRDQRDDAEPAQAQAREGAPPAAGAREGAEQELARPERAAGVRALSLATPPPLLGGAGLQI